MPAFERTRFGPAPLFTMVNAPRVPRDEADVALVVIFVPTTAEVMVSPCIVGVALRRRVRGGRPGARRREGTSTSRDSTMCARRAGGRACVIAQCVRDGCAWGLCMERERDSYWTTAYPVYRRGRARALYASPSTVSHDR